MPKNRQASVRAPVIDYSGAHRRWRKYLRQNKLAATAASNPADAVVLLRRRQLTATDAGTTRSIPQQPAPDYPSTYQVSMPKLINRLAVNSVNAPVEVRPGVALRIEDLHDNAFATPNAPWGILPQLTTASPEQLIEMADALAAAKYDLTRRGQYYQAWQAAWRERLCERILQGITKLGITPAN